MKKWLFVIPFVFKTAELMSVSIFGHGCQLEAHYYAEQVYVSQAGVATIYFSDDRTVTVPLKYVDDLQIQLGEYFRSFTYDNGVVNESKDPKCKGAI